MVLGGIVLGGMSPGGMIPGGMIPGGMSPEGMSPGGMTPGGMTPGGMSPGGKTLGGMTLGGMILGGMGPQEMAQEGRNPREATVKGIKAEKSGRVHLQEGIKGDQIRGASQKAQKRKGRAKGGTDLGLEERREL